MMVSMNAEEDMDITSGMVSKAIERAQRIDEEARQRGMGTTLVALFAVEDGIYVAHVGDSRVYRIRDGVLDQLALSGMAEEAVGAAKIIGHWLTFGPLLLFAAVPGSFLLGLEGRALVAPLIALAVGTPGSYSRECANRVLCEADLVFFIGSHSGGQW